MAIDYNAFPGTVVRQNYGRRLPEDKAPSRTRTAGEVQQFVVDFNYNTLPSFQANDAVVQVIPALSYILNARLFVKTAFAGGTSLAVGLATPAGVAVDLDGLITDANAPLANINLAGEIVPGTGAMVSPAAGAAQVSATGPIASVASQVVVTATGTFTAGAAKLVIDYIPAA